MFYKYFILSLCCSIVLLNSFAQQIFYSEIKSSNGRPDDRIYDLAIDNKNILFLGTESGILRYNGIKFNKIKVHGAKSRSLTDISFTKDNILWCRNFSNQIFYSEQKELYPLEGLQETIKGEVIVNFKIIDQYLYIATYDAIYILNANEKRIIKRIPFNTIETISTVNQFLAVSSIDGTFSFIKDTTIAFEVKANPGNYRLADNQHLLYLIDKNRNSNWIYQINTKDQTFSPLIPTPKTLKNNVLINNLNFVNENIIISSNQGAYLFQSNKWNTLIKNKNISDYIVDFQGGAWLSTIDNGLISIPSLNVNMFFEGFQDQYYRDIIKSPKGYLVSTNQGKVLEINKKGEILRSFNTNYGREIEFITLDTLHNILYTSLGSFNYNNPNEFTGYYFGKGLSIDRNNNIYYGNSSSSIVIIKGVLPIAIPVKEKVTEDHYYIRKERTRDVIFSPYSNKLYIAQVDKLLMYDENEKKELTTAEGLSIFANSFYIDDEDHLWVGTILQGVFKFKDGELIKHYNTNHLLNSDNCISINGYENFIYIITEEGVLELNTKNEEIININKKYSLNNIKVSKTLRNDKELLLVSKKGIIKLSPQNTIEQASPVLKILYVKNINGEEFENLNAIKHQEKAVEIVWGLLNYKYGDQQNVYYRLKNHEENWRSLAPSINNVVYNNLPSGKYIFEIKVEDDSSTLQSIAFTVLKPFWKKWWFLLIEFSALGCLFYLTIKITKTSVQKRQQIKENLIRSQLTAIRTQMNPHFLYNVLNSLQGLIYSNQMNQAGNYISIFSDHLRNILNMSDKQWVSLKEEIDSLKIYLDLEKLRFGEDFTYQINLESNIDNSITIPSMILQPYVENAVKHGLLNKTGDKKVSINFKLFNANTLEVAIIDNGIGREKSYIINSKRKDKPKSFATKAIDSRIDLLNQQLKQNILLDIIDLKDNDKAIGTAVYFKIPINAFSENNNHE